MQRHYNAKMIWKDSKTQTMRESLRSKRHLLKKYGLVSKLMLKQFKVDKVLFTTILLMMTDGDLQQIALTKREIWSD